MAPQSEALMEDAEVREEKLITFHAAPAEKESRSQLGEVTRSREVTEAELARNMSTTNATGKVQATRKMESAYSPAQSRNMAQDQGLIAMLSTGW